MTGCDCAYPECWGHGIIGELQGMIEHLRTTIIPAVEQFIEERVDTTGAVVDHPTLPLAMPPGQGGAETQKEE